MTNEIKIRKVGYTWKSGGNANDYRTLEVERMSYTFKNNIKILETGGAGDTDNYKTQGRDFRFIMESIKLTCTIGDGTNSPFTGAGANNSLISVQDLIYDDTAGTTSGIIKSKGKFTILLEDWTDVFPADGGNAAGEIDVFCTGAVLELAGKGGVYPQFQLTLELIRDTTNIQV